MVWWTLQVTLEPQLYMNITKNSTLTCNPDLWVSLSGGLSVLNKNNGSINHKNHML